MPVQQLPLLVDTVSSNYTIAASDCGRLIKVTAAVTITVPANEVATGCVVALAVSAGVTATVAQGASMTMQWAGQNATGTRHLSNMAQATILFTAGFTYISGAGIT